MIQVRDSGNVIEEYDDIKATIRGAQEWAENLGYEGDISPAVDSMEFLRFELTRIAPGEFRIEEVA